MLGLDLHALQSIQGLDPALHHPGLAGLVSKAIDQALGLGDPAILVSLLRESLLAAFVLLVQVAIVVAWIHREASEFQLGHDRGVAPKERAVVGDHHDATAELPKGGLEPLDRREIEVVGGLVQEQHVRGREQQLGEFDAHEPAATERAEGAFDGAIVEAEAREGPRDPRLALESAAEGEGAAAAVVAFREIPGNFFPGVSQTLHLALEISHLDLEGVEVGKHRRHLLAHRVFAGRIDLLLEQTYAYVAGCDDTPVVGRFQAPGDLQQCGLAGAVGSHQADAVASANQQVDVPEQGPRAKGSRDAFESQKHGANLV